MKNYWVKTILRLISLHKRKNRQTPKKKKGRKSVKKPKEDSEKSYCFEKDDISKLWTDIDDIKGILNSTTSLGKADSPQVFPRVLVSNRYSILDKSQDNSKMISQTKKTAMIHLHKRKKSKEIERLRAIISEREEKTVGLEKQLSNKDETIQVLQIKVSSLEAEK